MLNYTRIICLQKARPSFIAVTSDKYIPNVNIDKGQTDIIIPRGSIKDVVKVDKKADLYWFESTSCQSKIKKSYK